MILPFRQMAEKWWQMLREWVDLLVELYVGEDGVDPPCFGEHGAEGEGEAGHQGPRLTRTHVREGGLSNKVPYDNVPT